MESPRDALVGWYAKNARALPWRSRPDPYAVWVSEVMLQQTQVDTVIPFFARFLKAFPTVSALAAAPEDEVLALWSGLGYYRRARLLHAGAKAVVAQHGGRIPKDPKARLKLPGIGRYTAGAIGSIAFGQAEPIVDGNVARVLARLVGIETPLGASTTEKRLWAEAETWMSHEAAREVPDPGTVNQALMELGALQCKPKAPHCDGCPLSEHCYAFEHRKTHDLPVPRVRKAPKRVLATAVCATTEDGALCLQKGQSKLFGGLWGTPMVEGQGIQAARQALEECGIAGQLRRATVGNVEHTLTHRHYVVEVYQATEATLGGDARAFLPGQLTTIGISRLTQKIINAAETSQVPPS